MEKDRLRTLTVFNGHRFQSVYQEFRCYANQTSYDQDVFCYSDESLITFLIVSVRQRGKMWATVSLRGGLETLTSPEGRRPRWRTSSSTIIAKNGSFAIVKITQMNICRNIPTEKTWLLQYRLLCLWSSKFPPDQIITGKSVQDAPLKQLQPQFWVNIT